MSRSAVVAIVGSRDFPLLFKVREYIETLPLDTVVISGGARGVDVFAVKSAMKRGMETRQYLARWNRPDGSYNKFAGFERNIQMVEAADYVVAFWDGKSKGTAHTIKTAKKAGKRVVIISPEAQS